MILNRIWISFFVIAFIVALIKVTLFLFGHPEYGGLDVFPAMVNATYTSSRAAAEVAIGLTGAITLWMGLMKIGEKAGVIGFLSKLVGPVFSKLFPGIPKDHPAHGQIMMNFSANMLGIGNAATPLGLKAMESMQEINPEKEKASNAQIMFLVMNTAGFTLIPVTIMALRAEWQAKQGLPVDPTDVFVPILIASYCALVAGVAFTAIRQHILDQKLGIILLAASAFIGSIVYGFAVASPESRQHISSIAGNMLLFGVIVTFLLTAAVKKVNVYEAFIEGAKEGFNTVIKIIPYLVGMLVGIGVFRACGALDYLTTGIAWCFYHLGVNTDFVDSLPVAFMKPLSGGGTQGITVDILKNAGANSFTGRLSSIIYASADTTFYIVALYFGSVGIKRTRYAVTAGLVADLAGIVAGILVAYLFFH
ncbi:MAG TPA: nucleoside recognition domain-containing protein [Bacteroidia bacterium]|jgi:spore maturation protein SpmA